MTLSEFLVKTKMATYASAGEAEERALSDGVSVKKVCEFLQNALRHVKEDRPLK